MTKRAPAKAADTLRRETRFGAVFLRKYGGRMLLVFIVLLLPLWGFTELAGELHERTPFDFDVPILQLVHAMANGSLDHRFLLVSRIGYEWGVVPVDIVLVLVLALARRAREALFAALALGGSALLNIAAKLAYARERPALWESISPEHNFSFPSGHAMGSMTLAMVCILLAWRTRWRWPVLLAALALVPMVGFSRVYLGVHYPSDILAGWAAATAWVGASFLLVFHHHRHPWGRRGIPKTP